MEKAVLRHTQKSIRKTALANADAVFYKPLYDNIISFLQSLSPHYTVSGYYPILDEINILPVLRDCKNTTALPCTIKKETPLAFRKWDYGDTITTDIYGIPCPLDTAELICPDIFLVPLLAFDTRGYRLGYGGGFYDRTLAQTNAQYTIGIGLDCLQVETVPTDIYDQKLTHIITETQVIET